MRQLTALLACGIAVGCGGRRHPVLPEPACGSARTMGADWPRVAVLRSAATVGLPPDYVRQAESTDSERWITRRGGSIVMSSVAMRSATFDTTAGSQFCQPTL